MVVQNMMELIVISGRRMEAKKSKDVHIDEQGLFSHQGSSKMEIITHLVQAGHSRYLCSRLRGSVNDDIKDMSKYFARWAVLL